MKRKHITIIISLLIITGCTKKDLNVSPMSYKDITSSHNYNTNSSIQRFGNMRTVDGIAYAMNESSPYTGEVNDYYSNGQKKSESHYQNGKQTGLSIKWFENGQKEMEVNIRDGVQHGLATSWLENGQKQFEVMYENGTIVSDARKFVNDKSNNVLPTPNELAAANYGKPINTLEFESGVKNTLKDPYSAHVSCSTPEKAWFNLTDLRVYGYFSICKVNAKNGFGAYTGEETDVYEKSVIKTSGLEEITKSNYLTMCIVWGQCENVLHIVK